jgi:DNA-binding NtrC family response regulator
MHELVSLIVQRITGEASPEMTGMVLEAIAQSPGRNYAWPGNVRELEQAVRRILLTGSYSGEGTARADLCRQLQAGISGGTLDAAALLTGYCALLYERHGTYEDVARRTGLDRRTAKSYIRKHAAANQDVARAAI